MAKYAVGDVQGCWQTLVRLMEHIHFVPGRDELWLLGDLVGRGPNSLAVLDFAYREQESVHCILGNHDLALLAYAAGLARPDPRDRLDELLAAPALPTLISFLAAQPLAVSQEGFLLLHAGALPPWSRDEILARSKEVSRVLKGEQQRALLSAFFADHEGGEGQQRLAAMAPYLKEPLTSLRVLTCLRTLDLAGEMASAFKGSLAELPSTLVPWFRWPARALKEQRIACGHWSAIGLHVENNVFSLDGGCVWGRKLCALRLNDEAVFSVSSVEEAVR